MIERAGVGTNENTGAMTRQDWLHGWPRLGSDQGLQVLIGTGVYCVGCGKDHGVTTVAFSEEYHERAKDRPMPDWPFDEETCPVCWLRTNWQPTPPELPPWPKGKPRPLP